MGKTKEAIDYLVNSFKKYEDDKNKAKELEIVYRNRNKTFYIDFENKQYHFTWDELAESQEIGDELANKIKNWAVKES